MAEEPACISFGKGKADTEDVDLYMEHLHCSRTGMVMCVDAQYMRDVDHLGTSRNLRFPAGSRSNRGGLASARG